MVRDRVEEGECGRKEGRENGAGEKEGERRDREKGGEEENGKEEGEGEGEGRGGEGLGILQASHIRLRGRIRHRDASVIQRLIATRSPSVPSPGRPRRRPDSPSHAHSLHGALRVLRGAWERTRFHSARVAPAAVPWVQVPASAMGPLESFSTPHFFSLLFFYVSVYCFYFFC